MTELQRSKILIILHKAIDEAADGEDFENIDFTWQKDTTEKMALAALKALEKEIKEATK